MDGVAAGRLRCVNDLLDVQVWSDSAAGQQNGLIRIVDVECVGVVSRVDRDGRNPHVGGGADDANRDLSAIGYEKFGQSHRACRLPVIGLLLKRRKVRDVCDGVHHTYAKRRGEAAGYENAGRDRF